jgi:predicted small metal-binding protein
MMAEEIAFKDFPSSVSVKEFEAVLSLCKNQYTKVKEIVERREQFLENTHNKFSAAEASIEDDKIKAGLQKLVDALVAKADKELLSAAKDEIKDMHEITEFLIRFTPGNEYTHLDLSFLNNIKED